jgi:prepilin-type N-terminal cleavage/methylation domain-containing protein
MKSILKGFSLVELMIVVAIIGILAAIAIPNYTAYVRKGRQAEAKASLQAIYAGLKAYRANYDTYWAHFEAIGFRPEGDLRYIAGIDQLPESGTRPAHDLNDYRWAMTTGMTSPHTRNWCMIMFTPCTVIPGPGGGLPTWAGYGGSTGIVGLTFMVTAAADIGGSQDDVWQIDEGGRLTNPQSGL